LLEMDNVPAPDRQPPHGKRLRLGIEDVQDFDGPVHGALAAES